MPRYAFQIAMACVLGLCHSEEDAPPTLPPTNPTCVCKPVMRIEWEPTQSICNNSTFDWLLNTVLGQVSKQNENLEWKTEEMEELKQQLAARDASISGLEQQLSQRIPDMQELHNQVADIKAHNMQLLDEVEQLQAQRARVDPRPKDCADVQRYGFHYSGLYMVYPNQFTDGFEVFCELNTDGGGWTVLQRRQDGSQSFEQNWKDYKHGFGRMAKEFWLGNEKLFHMTYQRSYELRVDLTDWDGRRYYATYDSFVVDSETNLYTLHVGKYNGTAGNALKHHNNAPFTTIDNDNDKSKSGNCAKLYGGGGWWWVRCYDSNLNGIYSNRHAFETIVWFQLSQNHEPMKHVEMKMRPVGFKDGQ